jgi:sterol desaturase/sphingolipid hydroxylase (fatty acid hydroxylase superfamily)
VGSDSPLYAWFGGVSLWLAAGLIALVCIESAVRHLVFDRPVDKRTVTVNLGMWLFELVLRTASGGVRWLVFSAAATLAPWSWTLNAPTWLLLYLLVDLFYYSRHRLLHTTRLGWALHAPHHASTDLSLSSALRLGWIQRVMDDFFYVPLVLLGAPPLAVFIAVELNHASQLWCHTEVIGKLPLLDAILNTPSNHRVHHARDRAFADSNYGATFMLWDKLFGTYRREPGPLPLGWTQPYEGANPFIIQFRGLRDWWKDLAAKP